MQAAGQGHDSTAYICRECHANETRVRIVGGRRDVGKCETWGSKDRPAAGVRSHLHEVPTPLVPGGRMKIRGVGA